MTKVIAEVTSQKPNALTRSVKVSDVVSVGNSVQTKAMEVDAPIITAIINRVLFVLDLIASISVSGCCGSVAALQDNISSMSASVCKAAPQHANFDSEILNVFFAQYRTFKSSKYHRNDRQLPARSGRI